jgi:cobalt-zinc-cadmium resistance protein CzcA
MSGLPNLKRSLVSNFGLSVVNIYFEDGTDIYFARQLVNERLQMAREQMPAASVTQRWGLFQPVWDKFSLRCRRRDRPAPEEMRQIQDWLIKFNLQTVPGD